MQEINTATGKFIKERVEIMDKEMYWQNIKMVINDNTDELNMVLLAEELAELQQAALNKLMNKSDNIVEEIADTLFCIDVIRQTHNITDERLEAVNLSAADRDKYAEIRAVGRTKGYNLMKLTKVCAELIQTCSKTYRGKTENYLDGKTANVLNEIAVVTKAYEIEESALDEIRQYKYDRYKERKCPVDRYAITT